MELSILIGLPEKSLRGELRTCFFKNPGVINNIFLRKTLEFLALLLYPWKFWTKESFSPRNSGKLYYRPWKFLIFLDHPQIFYMHILFLVSLLLIRKSFIPFLSVSVLSIEQIIGCNGESHITSMKYFGVRLPHEQCSLY